MDDRDAMPETVRLPSSIALGPDNRCCLGMAACSPDKLLTITKITFILQKELQIGSQYVPGIKSPSVNIQFYLQTAS